MQQKALPSVEEAEAEDKIPEKSEGWEDEDVVVEAPPGPAGLSFLDDDLGAEGAVAVHVLDVTLNGGVGVVDEIVLKRMEHTIEGDRLMHRSLGESCRRSKIGRVAPEQAKLRIRIVAAETHPAFEKQVAAANHVGVRFGFASQKSADLLLELEGELFVGIEGKNPGTGAFLDGRVFLAGKSLPRLNVNLGVESASDLDGPIGRSGVDDDHFVGKLHG